MKNDRLLKKLFNQEIYSTGYLASFPQNDSAKITSIVATHNRSPYKNLERNPLFWYLKSLFNQRYKPSEIIIVNDGSEDYTKLVVDYFRKIGSIEIAYIKNRIKKGHPKSFSIGLSAAKYDLVYCTDDDSILSPYTIWGGLFCLTKMRTKNPNAALMLLPRYTRSTIPKRTVPKNEIGNINLSKGIITSNFDTFPEEYLKNPVFLDKDRKILTPFKIKNLCFHFLARKKLLKKVVVPEKFGILNDYGWETELGLRISEGGYDSYYVPDPKFHEFHERYGSLKPKVLSGEDWSKRELIDGISLTKIISESSRKNLNTGSRLKKEDWYSSKIRGFLRVLYKRNKRAARGWAIFTYKQFVLENNKEFRADVLSVRKRVKREKIWEESVKNEIGEKELSALKLHPEIKLK
ncbi:glycosyltransferase family 2 protein [Patescibacteria group bacterium]|nr:glycosyltransferase family 2 protein [Patescibacteria group bacterium]